MFKPVLHLASYCEGVRVVTACVDENKVAPKLRVGPNEFGHGLHRVAEVNEKSTGKAVGHESAHGPRVAKTSDVERMHDRAGIGRQKVEAGMSHVEAGLADVAD